MHPAYSLAKAPSVAIAAIMAIAVAMIAGCRAPASGAASGVSPERVTEAEAAARRAVAEERSIAVASFPERSLGVTPFAVSATDTTIAPLAYGLADILATDLVRSGQLQLVDRLRLDALLREVQLVEAGRVDSSTAPRVGKLVGARRLVVGTLARRADGQLTIDARIADVATGTVRAGVSASAPLADILSAEKALAFRLLGELGVNLTPAARALIEERPTRNLAALLAYGRAVRYEVQGDYPRAAAQYQAALSFDPAFALAAQRLSQVPGAVAPPPARAEAGSEEGGIRRATALAVDRLNPVFFSPLGGGPRAGAGGPGDPTFPSQFVTVIITITTPP